VASSQQTLRGCYEETAAMEFRLCAVDTTDVDADGTSWNISATSAPGTDNTSAGQTEYQLQIPEMTSSSSADHESLHFREPSPVGAAFIPAVAHSELQVCRRQAFSPSYNYIVIV